VLDKYIAWKRIVKSGGFFNIFFEGACFLSRPPIFIGRDEQGRLHSTVAKAVEFKDGYGEYYVHGAHFDEYTFKKAFVTKDITATEVMQVKNEEVKSVLLEEFGSDIYTALPHSIIDEGEEPNLYLADGSTRRYVLVDVTLGGYVQRYVFCEDYSTDKKYLLPVPNPSQSSEAGYDLDTYRGAVAWVSQNPRYWEELRMRT